MKHFASPDFWSAYRRLPDTVRALADKNFALLKADPRHPSLHFKTIGRYRSVRVGLRYRALAVEVDDGLLCSGSLARGLRRDVEITSVRARLTLPVIPGRE